ncbi:MAG: multidrug efflux SMR transporter [Desulforhopalus sp.]|nr:multidrug efflux SMR transporter [Desulforhopalus sp.]
MAWVYLLAAGIFEIGWPLGFKLSQVTNYRIPWLIFSVLSMAISGYLLWLAQREIPLGTAYAIWTGIGAVGAFSLGILLFKDPVSFLRFLSAFLVVIGIVGLKLTN